MTRLIPDSSLCVGSIIFVRLSDQARQPWAQSLSFYSSQALKKDEGQFPKDTDVFESSAYTAAQYAGMQAHGWWGWGVCEGGADQEGYCPARLLMPASEEASPTPSW